MGSPGIVILGAGMAGCGAAHQLRENGLGARMYEARHRPGGLTTSYTYDDGFIFDEGVHISFSSNERIRELFAKAIGGEHTSAKIYCNNFWRGHWIKHPAQVNLHGLPTDLIVACIKDFVAANAVENPKIANYEDWLYAAFGRTFADTFPMKYTVKYHTTLARNMTTDWLGPRLYRPNLEEVLKGALEPEPLDVFYVDQARYPLRGGFGAYLDGLLPPSDVHCDHEVVGIDVKSRTLTFRNGTSTSYQHLISSIPLTKLIPIIAQAPADVREASGRLAATQCAVINIGINRPIFTRPQWSYFYDDDICFARVSYRDNFSKLTVPAGCGGFQAETYFSDKYRPMTGKVEDWIEPTIDGLIKAGLIEDRSEVIHRTAIWAPFANIIFDQDRPKAIETVHGFLDDVGIAYCGRYGDWGYIWTDQAFMSGERAAKTTMRRLKGTVAA